MCITTMRIGCVCLKRTLSTFLSQFQRWPILDEILIFCHDIKPAGHLGVFKAKLLIVRIDAKAPVCDCHHAKL